MFLQQILSNDWFEVRDGRDENSTLIGKRICGDKCDSTGCVGPYSSSGNVLYLHFHSEASGRLAETNETIVRRFKIKAVSESGAILSFEEQASLTCYNILFLVLNALISLFYINSLSRR